MKLIHFTFIPVMILMGTSLFAEDSSPGFKPGAVIAQKVFHRLNSGLSNLTSYECEAEVTVVHSDEMMKLVNESKQQQFKTRHLKLHTWSEGDSIKSVEDYVDNEGHSQEVDTEYVDNKQCVFQSGTSNAAIYPRRLKLVGEDAIYNMCPAFMEYTFLNVQVNKFGVVALSPSSLTAQPLWNSAFQCLQSCIIEKDGDLTVRLKGTAGYSMIDFQPLPGPSQSYRTRSIKFFRNDDKLLYQVDLLNYTKTNGFNDLATKIRLTTYGDIYGNGKVVHLATWTFSVTRFQLNAPIDDSVFTFDPATVQRIMHGAS